MTSQPAVRVGVLGAGAWARGAHLPGYRRDPRCRVVAIADVAIDRAREAAREFDIPLAVADPDELVRRDDIDVIDVCTPSHTHFELAWSALEAGKHVLCEKPVAYDYRDTERACDLARRKKLKTKVGLTFRYSPRHALHARARRRWLHRHALHLQRVRTEFSVARSDDPAALVVHKTAGNAYEHVTLNERQFPPFADVRVRRALVHALDRELLTKTILDGLAPVAHGPIQPVSWAYTDRITRYAFDPERARALLDEAGWQTSASGIRQRDGRPLAFTLITQAGYAIRETMAQAIERQLRDVGVNVTVELHDGTAISALWFEGRFDAMLHWWQMPSDPELTTFFAADRTPPAGRNINYFEDDNLTALLYESDRTVDRDERKRLLHRIQAIVADAAPEIPLYSVTRLDAVPAALQHFKGNPTNTGIFWNVHEWELAITSPSTSRPAK